MKLVWPYDIFDVSELLRAADEDGSEIAGLAAFSLHPPFPWGQRLYGRLLRERGNELDGHLIECGVAKGGMSLFLARHAQRLGKKHFALDSFEGLPAPTPIRDNPYFREGDYAAREERGCLLDRFRHEIAQRQLQDVIEVVAGFFSETLDRLPPDDHYAFIHIDVDLYQSVLDVLEHLYPRLVPDGILVIDDFFHQARGPARAAETFFAQHGQTLVYHVSFPYSVVIFKAEPPKPGLLRSVDGNRYSFDLLRSDSLFREVVGASAARAEAAGLPRRADEARLLLALLEQTTESGAEIYDYWRALAEYWQDMDSDRPDLRAPIRI